MVALRRINDRFSVGLGHPDKAELAELAEQGFRAVVNLRPAEEEGQPLQPDEEGHQVEALGMDYRHIPVAAATLGPELVDRFRREVDSLEGPVYVHCASGKRSGAFTIMHVAAERGMSGDEALSTAADLGFECDSQALADFVRDYVDAQTANR